MAQWTEEQKTFASSIGATHHFNGCYWKGGGFDETGQPCPFRWDRIEGWVLAPAYADVNDSSSNWILDKIDYSGVDGFSWTDFQFAVEKLVEYCDQKGIVCDQLDTVQRMLKEL